MIRILSWLRELGFCRLQKGRAIWQSVFLGSMLQCEIMGKIMITWFGQIIHTIFVAAIIVLFGGLYTMTSTFVGFTCGRFHVSGTTNGSISGRFHHGDRYLNCGRSTDPSHQFRSNILHPCNRLDQKSAKLSKLSSKNICLKNLTMTSQFPAIYGVSSKNNRS